MLEFYNASKNGAFLGKIVSFQSCFDCLNLKLIFSGWLFTIISQIQIVVLNLNERLFGGLAISKRALIQ